MQNYQIEKIVFILGCGRSGTTILGRSLSCHPKITYLHEPRHLWSACYPETDIWSHMAIGRKGKLVLTAEDVREKDSHHLSKLFLNEAIKTGKPILVEKLPINNFRLRFIYSIFPEANFIHILRNGIEVAKSIEKRVPLGWFGYNNYKWNLLVDHARSQSHTFEIVDVCTNDYERGLLEWRLSLEAIYSFVPTIPKESFLEITYDDFVDNPLEVMQKILNFIDLNDSNEVDKFLIKNIQRRSKKVAPNEYSDKDKIIGGRFLLKKL
jgi:hypothetical protein